VGVYCLRSLIIETRVITIDNSSSEEYDQLTLTIQRLWIEQKAKITIFTSTQWFGWRLNWNFVLRSRKKGNIVKRGNMDEFLCFPNYFSYVHTFNICCGNKMLLKRFHNYFQFFFLTSKFRTNSVSSTQFPHLRGPLSF